MKWDWLGGGFNAWIVSNWRWGVHAVAGRSLPPPLLQGSKIGPGAIILMVGTLLSGYSAFKSYSYFNEVSRLRLLIGTEWWASTSFQPPNVDFEPTAIRLTAMRSTTDLLVCVILYAGT
jgi:hypothetical protein